MSFFGESWYGESFYSGYPMKTRNLTFYTVARVVKPVPESPPVFDSWVYGLAQRFNWLQQGIQTFGLANKIEYAAGSDLDDQWGNVYSLPRLSGESDNDYRTRLQTYVGVLTGSGTVPNVTPILNFLIGQQSGIVLETRWPAQVFITGDTMETLRAIDQHRARLEAMLPGMFAAGVDYSLVVPFIEWTTVAQVSGDRTLDLLAIAAIRSDVSLSLSTVAAVAVEQSESVDAVAAIQAERNLYIQSRAAVRAVLDENFYAVAAIQADQSLPLSGVAAIRADRSLSLSGVAAIRSDVELQLETEAAIAKTFERRFTAITSVWRTDIVEFSTVAAVRTDRSVSFSAVARVRKP